MGRIPDEDVQRVREATDVVALISESVVLKKKGRLFWGLCPFHGEKTPSFKVDPATQLWHCFGCGEGGDAFGFLMRQEHMEFPDAVRLLADRGRIEIREEGGGVDRGHKERLTEASDAAARFYHRTLVMSRDDAVERARSYLSGRGFGSEVAKEFMVGYAPGRGALVRYLKEAGFTDTEMIEANLALKGDRGLKDRFYERVMFPIHDLQGRAVGFGGRVMGDAEPKYLNTQETPIFHKSRNLYAIDRAKNEIVKAGEAVVVEGYTDVIALHAAGIKNVVATLGTALTRDHVKLLGRFASRIVYLFDADEAGLRAAERAGEFLDVLLAPPEGLGSAAVDLAVAVVPDGKDPADYVLTAGAEGMRKVIGDASPLLRFLVDRRLDAHDLSLPEGRARALTSVARLLASMKSTVFLHEYMAHVQDRLGLDYLVIQQAVNEARPEQVARDGEGEDAAGVSAAAAVAMRRQDPGYVAAREYVRLVAQSGELRTSAREVLSEGLVHDEILRRTLSAVVDAGSTVGTELYTLVAETDPEAGAVLSGLVMDDEDSANKSTEARDVLSKLKEFALERQIIEKKAQMRALSEVKASAEYDELFREIAGLQVKLDRVHRGLADCSDTDGSVG